MITLKQLLLIPIRGNAWQDMELMNLTHEFIIDTTQTMADRAEALNHLDFIMGVENLTPVTAKEVEDYTVEYGEMEVDLSGADVDCTIH